MFTCVHTRLPCNLAQGCEWNVNRPSQKAEACEWFRPVKQSGGDISCLSCQMPNNRACAFKCFRLAHRASIQTMHETDGDIAHEPARRIPANHVFAY